MNRLICNIKINLAKKYIIYTTITLLIIFNFLRFIEFSHKAQYANFYDLIIDTFSNQLIISYFLFSIFSVLLYNIANKKSFHQYIFLKFNNRASWYNSNIFFILVISIFIVLFIFFQCIIESILTLSFDNSWSQYCLNLVNSNSLIRIYDPKTLEYIIDTISPLTYSLMNLLYMIFYFFSLGIIYFNLSMCLKKKNWAFTILCVINCINISLYKSNSYILRKISFIYNVIIIDSTSNSLDFSIYLSRLNYWIFMISLLYGIGFILKSKVTLNFGDNL